MSALTWTLATLKARLADELDEETGDGSEFDTHLSELIQLGEVRLVRDLDLEIFDTEANFTGLVAGTQTLTKPAALVAIKYAGYVNALGAKKPLLQRSREYCDDYWPTPTTTTAAPLFWCEDSTTGVRLFGTPDGNVASVYCGGIYRPTSIVDGGTWLAANCPDSLLYAALVECESFLGEDGRAKKYEADYYRAMRSSRSELRRSMHKLNRPHQAQMTSEGGPVASLQAAQGIEG